MAVRATRATAPRTLMRRAPSSASGAMLKPGANAEKADRFARRGSDHRRDIAWRPRGNLGGCSGFLDGAPLAFELDRRDVIARHRHLREPGGQGILVGRL